MKTRALDQDGDWQFGRGLQSCVTEKNALMQNVKTRLRQWRNNCFFAMSEGVDYTNYLDIGRKYLLDLDVKRVILQTKGVLRITTFNSTLNTTSRALSIQATIETVFGNVPIETEV